MKKKIFFAVLIVVLLLIIASSKKKTGPGGTPGQPGGGPVTASCNLPMKVGFKVTKLGGVKTAIWYPTSATEKQYSYNKDTSTVLAPGGAVESGCGTFPLVVFSHGFGGCGAQSLFFTEELARHGYVVAAPDHKDAVCSSDGASAIPSATSEPSLFDPKSWSENSYADRKVDLQTVISQMLASPEFKSSIDSGKIALAGHSVGGYAALGLAGAWSSWKDGRVKALLLFSPYAMPFVNNKTLSAVHVPVMYQGADFDLAITPFIEGASGAYALSNSPKYFAKLHGGNHFVWTNLLCAGVSTVSGCIKAKPEAALIDSYGIAFLDKYLKGSAAGTAATLTRGTGLSAYQSAQ